MVEGRARCRAFAGGHRAAREGFDDVPLASFLTPSLTSVAPDHEAMADAVISMIVDRIEGSRSAEDYRVFTAPVRLAVRESTRA